MAPIDVFIPTWNSEKTIMKCIQSINKVIPKARIFVIDKFSEDKTSKIARNFPNVHVVQYKGNLGHTRELMCKLAESEWFIMIDSDIYLNDNWLLVIERFKQYSKDVGAVFGVKMPTSGLYRKVVSWSVKKSTFPVKNPKRLDTSNLMIRKSACEGFVCRTFAFEDFLLGKHINNRGFAYYYVPALCYHYFDEKDYSIHAKWGGANLRITRYSELWEMIFSLFYVPLFQFPPSLKFFAFKMQFYGLIGYLQPDKYMYLNRQQEVVGKNVSQ